MVLKRDHREADVEELAKKFREDWSEGEVIRSWLRRHGEELRNLVRKEDWSWENIGKALSLAGIQFKTGKGWTGENVRRAVDLAMKPKKVRAGKSQTSPAANVSAIHLAVTAIGFAVPKTVRGAGISDHPARARIGREQRHR